MNAIQALIAATGASIAFATVTPAVSAEDSGGLVKVSTRQFQSLTVLPGADFRQFTKVFVEPASVTFRSDWLRDMNANRIAILQGTSKRTADEIAREVATGLHESLVRALQKGGYQIAAEPGPGVLSLQPGIVKLYINAPKSVTNALPSRVYTSSAGEATLELDLRDAASGRVVGHVTDAQTIGDRGDLRGSMRVTNSVTNGFDLSNTFDDWGRATVKSLDDLRQTPVAAPGSQAQ